jgi:hypothetical protein
MTRRQSGRWGLDDAYARLFNPDSIETVAGKVVVLDSFVPQKGMARGLVIHVDTESGELIPVQVGPLWYLKENNVKILPEDRVSVRGSRIYFEGTSVLMAMEVTIQGKGMLRLRNRKGRPVWSTLVPGKNTNGRRVSAVSYL